MCGRFVTDIRYHLVNDDKLSLWPSCGAQMLEYGDAIFVSPVVDHFAKKKHGDVLLPRGLRVKEAVAFRTQMSVMPTLRRRK